MTQEPIYELSFKSEVSIISISTSTTLYNILKDVSQLKKFGYIEANTPYLRLKEYHIREV